MNEIEKIPAQILQLISDEQAWHYNIVPYKISENTLTFFCNEQKISQLFKNELNVIFGKQIELQGISEMKLFSLLSSYYRDVQSNKTQLFESDNRDILDKTIEEANKYRASDIHFEPYDEKCRIRFRVDGRLIEKYIIEKGDYMAIINRLKIKANLDIAEKRRPQDGRIKIDNKDDKYDIRVSVVPTIFGEKVVLRILKKGGVNIDIEKIGFNQIQKDDFLKGIKKSNGIVLISGPTGSGKTTTLYATLKLLNQKDVNISTIEDPVEYTIDGVNQVQLYEQIGLSFSAALRTFLRQDPDIIMLGEIRDLETAEMAIRAALTGHLVLSTIHTNSAWGTISRLIDMGVPSYLLASVLNVSVAQRLIRLLCPECKIEIDYELVKNTIGGYIKTDSKSTFYDSKGCSHCHFTGYHGRKAIFEVIPIDKDMSLKIKEEAFDVDHKLQEMNILTLKDQALQAFYDGETSIDEIYPLLLNNH